MAERIVSPSEQEPDNVARVLYPHTFFELSMEYYDDLVLIEGMDWEHDSQKKDAITNLRKSFIRKNVDYLSLAPDKNIYCLVEFWDDPEDEYMRQLTDFGLDTGTHMPHNPSFDALKHRVEQRGNTLKAFHVLEVWAALGENVDLEEQKSEIQKKILGAFAEAAANWRTESK